jgi:uncharacterized repeat protein (TIGR03803 family)
MKRVQRFHVPMAVLAICMVASIAVRAQTFTTLVYFNSTDGATPVDTPLVQGFDGNFYGTTLGGGTNLSGTVFRITPAGKLATLYSFCSQANCTDGSEPYGGLVLGRDGNFYGTTSMGGTDGISGTIFEITLRGVFTTLHSFDGTDGAASRAPMILGSDGNFYGITQNGGSNNAGTIFRITPNGQFTSLHSFNGTDGTYSTGPLVQANDGNLYGSTEIGGANEYGSLFKVTTNGTFSTFYSFDSFDGSAPASGLIQAADGNLYGTTYQGGPNVCSCGTVFKITLQGTLTTLHSFGAGEPNNPIAGVIQATDGNFYGTSYAGGTNNWGTVYEMTPAGVVTTLHSFVGSDGAQPYAPIVQTTSGKFYGTATNGTGTANYGTVYRVTNGLGPFVSLVETSGKIGQSIVILGQGFEGTTSVTFNGTPATFTVVSASEIKTAVPTGATNGKVQVTTLKGVLTSNVVFHVR